MERRIAAKSRESAVFAPKMHPMVDLARRLHFNFDAYGREANSASKKKGILDKIQEKAELVRYKRTFKGGNKASRMLAGSMRKDS